MSQVSTYLWFDNGKAEEAARFYTALLPNSAVTEVAKGPNGHAMVVTWTLDGQQFVGLNGGPEYSLTGATSVYVSVDSQQEVDRLWDALTADGGEEGPCGWLTDRYGLSWQIVPDVLPKLLSDPDPERAGRAAAAMQQMKKLDIKTLQDAAAD